MRRGINAAGYYLAAAALSLAILAWVMKLWHADLKVPFAYLGDALMAQLWVKGVVDNGWYLHNEFVGAPGALDMPDYPMADNLHFLVFKLLALACPNYAVVYNVFILVSFPLITVSALFVLRRMGFSRDCALLGSLLFAFLPFHFHSGAAHVFLSAYYLVPFAVLVVWWLYQGEGRYIGVRGQESGVREERASRSSLTADPWPLTPIWGGWPFLTAALICILLSSAGVYYAFFACFFLIVGGVASSSWHHSGAPLKVAGALVTVTTLGVLANLAPSFLYRWNHGANPEAVVRLADYADMASLTIKDLLVPVEKPEWLGMHLYGPYSFVSLGILGSLGFLVLVGRLLVRGQESGIRRKGSGVREGNASVSTVTPDPRPPTPPSLLDALSTLNVLAVLLGTFGGFGFLLNMLVTSWIRCYCRLGVYIAFFALAALLLVLERFAVRWGTTPGRRLAFQGLLAALLALGIFDQTNMHKLFVPEYARARSEFSSDATFVQQIEEVIPGGTVFQLPYVGFPETGAVQQVGCYDHLRGYLHSRTLHWSHGAMRGREADLWQRRVAAAPVEEMVRSLKAARFDGIYVDRNGYADGGAGLEGQLARLLYASPMVSPNQRLAYFSLRAFRPQEHQEPTFTRAKIAW
jgi:phosphoglycerol transferase